jgi:hypothetical protein
MNVHRVYGWLSPFFRRRRMERFRAVLAPGERESILDVGGMPDFWRGSGVRSRVTLLNLAHRLEGSDGGTGAAAPDLVAGDGCAMTFPDRAFDIVFSNSVIEHVGSWERQQAFAAECRRVGRRLWVQTPAREFLFEPHLLAPFVHWLPRGAQRRLIRNCTPRGWLDRPGATEVETFLREVRLLTLAEMRLLFPDCAIHRERFLGFTKSYIALRTQEP